MIARRKAMQWNWKSALGPIAAALCWLMLAGAAHAIEMNTSARHAVLMDAATGDILFEKAGDVPMAPASMSKLMTVEMVFSAIKSGRLSLDDTFHVSENAWAMEGKETGSEMFVMVNDDISIADLLRGIIVQSGNDACVVVAEGLAGTEEAFAQAMNQRAEEIGLTNSTFANSHGWPDPDHKMSARDLAVLARHLILEYPDLYPMFNEREFTWSNIRQYNRNPLIGSSIAADGLKTGHTEESGYGLVASAVQGDRRLILVLNGLESENARRNEGLRLMQFGFREFDSYELLLADQVVAAAPVFGGNRAEIPLVVHEPVTRILSRDARRNMKVTVNYESPVLAPVAAGAELGQLKISVPDAPDTLVPVYAAESASRMGPMSALATGLKHLFLGLMGESGSANPAAAS